MALQQRFNLASRCTSCGRAAVQCARQLSLLAASWCLAAGVTVQQLAEALQQAGLLQGNMT
jgi:hypothetical protein